jgi:hypothetical protein
MRSWKLYLIFFVPTLVGLTCSGQDRANVSVVAERGLPRDPRPFGKYLVEICTISGATDRSDVRSIKCAQPPSIVQLKAAQQLTVQNLPSAAIELRDQALTIGLACDPQAQTSCQLATPKVGSDFFVTATSDSGLPVQQRVLVGSVSQVGGSRTVHYHANGPGPIVIRATMQRTSIYNAAGPVDLVLQVATVDATGNSSAPSCAVLPPSTGTQTATLDAGNIVTLLGNPTPFIPVAQGSNSIVVYATREELLPRERKILASLQGSISALAGRTGASLGITATPAQAFTVELTIPHASALGDLATRLSTLNYSQFTLQDVGRNKIRVTSPSQPDCATWKGFLSDIREVTWQLMSNPMSYKLYYLSSSDVFTAFSGLSPTPATAAAGAAATTPAASTPSAAGNTPATTAATGTSASSASITVTQPPGSNIQISSDTTPCVVAGLTFGNSTACGGSATAAAATSAGAASGSTTAPAATPSTSSLAMTSVAVAAGTGEQTPPDLLVYSDTNPGDDSLIAERNRVLAQLDLPRPEMILTAWVTQNSSANPQAMGAFSNMVNDLIEDYDRQFEAVVLNGWASVKTQSEVPSYFNEAFRSYIEDRFVADTYTASKPGSSVQELSQSFLNTSQAKMQDPASPMQRTEFGICARGHYCLGYNTLFRPIKPALTDLLITIIAAQDPVRAARNAILEVEGRAAAVTDVSGCTALPAEVHKRCEAIWSTLDLTHQSPAPETASCSKLDAEGILGSLVNAGDPRVHLRCFQQKVDLLLSPAPTGTTRPRYGAGLLRAAIADFLFNYKMSQQYPHEFTAYDLTQSADALNKALSPLIDAFNRDLRTYQTFVRADMQYRVEQLNARTDGRCCVKRLFGLDKPSFFNDGLVTVRTISGQPTIVNATSQSFLNASSAPQTSAILNSVAGANAFPAGTTTTTPAIPVVSSPALGAVAAGLANYQNSYAQIGRSLAFSATPRSLNTASSAEIAVTLFADESAGGPLYTGPGQTDPTVNTSRVANHDTTSRVRVDSIKLFEVSSFSAIVQRSRSRFPLLPPFVEIPYIGTFAGVPLGPAKEFHSSIAIISAYVVPTAADIAYGTRFASDLVVDGLNPGTCGFFKGAAGPDITNVCVFRKMYSMTDVGAPSIREFNKNLTRCLANDTSVNGCSAISFNSSIEVSR